MNKKIIIGIIILSIMLILFFKPRYGGKTTLFEEDVDCFCIGIKKNNGLMTTNGDVTKTCYGISTNCKIKTFQEKKFDEELREENPLRMIIETEKTKIKFKNFDAEKIQLQINLTCNNQENKIVYHKTIQPKEEIAIEKQFFIEDDPVQACIFKISKNNKTIIKQPFFSNSPQMVMSRVNEKKWK